MVERLQRAADEARELQVRGYTGSRNYFVATVWRECFSVRDTAAKAHALRNHAQILFARQVVGANGGSSDRVGGAQGNLSATFRRYQCWAEAKAVLFALVESVIHVVCGAEDEL